MEAAAEIDELRAALAARDADLAARDADLAARDDHIARLEKQLGRVLAQLGRVAELEAELATLRELLSRDSSHSNEPPSSDPPGTGAKAPKEKKSEGRRRGGQRGHEGSHRGLLPAERMDAFGPAGRIGEELLDYTAIVFDYWSMFREGRLSRAELIARMAPVRLQVEALLERAMAKNIKGLSGSCEDILEHREALWTFVERAGVEPTNNHAERELRAFVLWRRRSFGSQSERGERFAERMMTIAHTARKQGRSVLDFLVACCAARPQGAPAPSLFAAT